MKKIFYLDGPLEIFVFLIMLAYSIMTIGKIIKGEFDDEFYRVTGIAVASIIGASIVLYKRYEKIKAIGSSTKSS